MGQVALPSSVNGHRIFVDGRVVGESLRTLRLACGSHTVRIGSAGTNQQVVVPCGGQIALR
jgi:hypothetical protein